MSIFYIRLGFLFLTETRSTIIAWPAITSLHYQRPILVINLSRPFHNIKVAISISLFSTRDSVNNADLAINYLHLSLKQGQS